LTVEPVDDGGSAPRERAEGFGDAKADHVGIEPLGEQPADRGERLRLLKPRPLVFEEPGVLPLERLQGAQGGDLLRVRVARRSHRIHPLLLIPARG
jgi:hypothetical protein